MLHIITIHYKDKWVDIQRNMLKEFVTEPYKVYTRLGENYKKHKNKFDGALDGSGHLSESIGLILDNFVIDNLKEGDKVLTLDSDAFPIAPISKFLNEKLKDYPIVSCQEPMWEWDMSYKIPHPMFMVFKAEHILHNNLSHYLRNIIKDKNNNWWGGVLGWMSENNYNYYPMVRSNKVNMHDLYFGIYEDLIYHHGAGSRRMIARTDRLRSEKTGEDLDYIANQNKNLSNLAFEQIEKQCDTFMDYLMEKYNGEVDEIRL